MYHIVYFLSRVGKRVCVYFVIMPPSNTPSVTFPYLSEKKLISDKKQEKEKNIALK